MSVDPEYNPVVIRLVIDNLHTQRVPDLTSYPCSLEQYLRIRSKVRLALRAILLDDPRSD